ncbi:putative Anaphase-promoting complex subunit 11 [Glarea lozoyensis 74030]|uniref:Putative Anaphase-promoting complex subunit 11 n=1 Tax=Glarea lozoyensis (strain ATCC 74030 / MF5533) TaxID=1104152 RepID=H0EIN7_GLAL7|nr:putative Anaphase-promoting complex subunit 11 [Glarea lozoyensis 74030]
MTHVRVIDTIVAGSAKLNATEICHFIGAEKSSMKVKIRKWNAVATWRWDIPEDDVCGICQVHFDGTCPKCTYPGDDCKLHRVSYPTSPAVRRVLTETEFEGPEGTGAAANETMEDPADMEV